MTSIPALDPHAHPSGRASGPDDRARLLRRSDLGRDEFFAHQPTGSQELPDPAPLLRNLAISVIEVMAGAREIDQLSRWVTEEVYRNLLTRAVLAKRRRDLSARPASRPAVSLGSTTVCEPRDGIVEAVVTVHGRARTRAVAFRLEGLDGRWRATAVHVL